MVIIGLTGTKGSGKGTVADYLVSKGFRYISLSDMVREEARKTYATPTAKQLIETGNRLREAEGLGVLAKKAAAKIGIEMGNFIVDGIRNPADVEVLRQLKGFVLISVDATRKIRYERIVARGREDRPKSFREFEAIDERDLGKNELQSGQRVKDTMNLADAKIINDGSIQELQWKVDAVISKFI